MKFEFIWNGKKAEDMGVKVISLPPLKQSTERVTEQEVEGRDGSLTELDGYETDTKQVEADYIGTNPRQVSNWLKGSGDVIFGNMDDRYYKARINNFVPISQIIENHLYSFPVAFRCQPFGYLLDGKEEKTISNGTVLFHDKADYISLPLITINGTGACTFTINSRSFNILEIGGTITIDSDIEEVLNGKGNQMIGKFPYLDAGENTISWTGTNITSVILKPNWRAL